MEKLAGFEKLHYDFKQAVYESLKYGLLATILVCILFSIIGLPFILYRYLLICLTTILFIFLIRLYSLKTSDSLQIYIGPIGIKWGNSKVLTWHELNQMKSLRYRDIEEFTHVVDGSIQKISFDPYTNKSLILLLLKYCPEDHQLRKAAVSRSQKTYL